MVVLKIVKVKRGAYSTMKNPDNVKIYLDATVKMGSTATLYKDPAIPAAYYSQGQAASKAINDAKVVRDNAPTTGNQGLYLAAGDNAISWLNGYADKVEPIANADINRTTRVQAAVNISLSNLTPQQLENVDKGDPDTPIMAISSEATGDVLVAITNGETYNPTRIVIIAIESASEAVVTLDGVDLQIVFAKGGSAKIKSAQGKGAFNHFTDLKGGEDYDFYTYAQNGKTQISKISKKITFKA